VLDFGVSRFIEATSSVTQGPIGTPRYMSPEQCLGRPVDHRADVFALAVVAYRALTGRPAFSASEERSVLERIVKEQPIRPSALVALPEDVDLALALGLAKDRDQRFGSGPELADALARAATHALPETLRTRARSLLFEAPWSERG
jgi:serine/threonine-protein kinase